MFVRTKRSVRKGKAHEYLQIVRSYREAGRVRQQVVATLGRRERLVASHELDGLVTSWGRFSSSGLMGPYSSRAATGHREAMISRSSVHRCRQREKIILSS